MHLGKGLRAARYNRIHPRDLARVLVACLFPDAQREDGSTVEVWTESFGRKNPSLSPEFDWRKPETILPDALSRTLAPGDVGQKGSLKLQEVLMRAAENN